MQMEAGTNNSPVVHGFGQLSAASQRKKPFDYRLALQGCDRFTVNIIGIPFLTLIDREISALMDAFERSNWRDAERLAHTQKGLVASFGANPLYSLFYRLELSARANVFDTQLLNELRAELSIFCPVLADSLRQVTHQSEAH